MWLGKKLHVDEHLVIKEDGLVAISRAARETEKTLTRDLLDRLKSIPHNPAGVLGAGVRELLPIECARTPSHRRTTRSSASRLAWTSTAASHAYHLGHGGEAWSLGRMREVPRHRVRRNRLCLYRHIRSSPLSLC